MDNRMIAHRDHAALMAAIIDHPDDDLPRLAFADYCEDVGEVERGELVRVQIELIRPCEWQADYNGLSCPEYNAKRVSAFRVQVRCKTCEMRSQLASRERQLLESHGAEWCEWLADSLGFNLANLFRTWGCEGGVGHHWLWRRGFIEKVHAPLADWLRLSSEWLQQTPLRVYKPLKLPGERLTRSELFGSVIRLWQCEKVGRLHTLDLTSIMAGSSSSHHWYGTFTATSRYAYRPWRGLQRVIVPHQSSGMEVQCGWWQRRIPGIEVVFDKQGGEPS